MNESIDDGGGGDETKEPQSGRDPGDRPEKGDKDVPDKSIDAADDGRTGRATGDTRDSNLIERACDAVDKVVDFLKGNDLFGFSEERSKPVDQMSSEFAGFDPETNSCQPGERASNWMGQDAVGDISQVQEQSKGGLGDFIAGVDDFCRNYTEMTSKKTGATDKFFHCNANCEAAQRGPGGELAAKVISYGREVIDVGKNVLAKGMSPAESIKDCREDLGANRIGREAGRSGQRCFDACRRDWTREF
jgi:hypothetical protein